MLRFTAFRLNSNASCCHLPIPANLICEETGEILQSACALAHPCIVLVKPVVNHCCILFVNNMPCKTMLLGDFDAKINRIYMCSKQFAFFLVSRTDTKINRILYLISQNLHRQPCMISIKVIKTIIFS